jgi:hypothetical protein
MHPNKIILIEVFSYVLLYMLIWFLAPKFHTPTGDAAGKGMAAGFLMLAIIAIFFLIAIALTVTNFFVLKGVTSAGIRFLAFVPILVSVTHMVYTYFF